MSAPYTLNVFLHILAAFVWLGGMFFLGLVGAPALRAVEPPALRSALFRALGLRFRRIGWIAIGILLLTGILNLHFRGLLRPDSIGSAAFWATPYGVALAWKLGLVTAMLVLSALHDFVLGPRSSRLDPRSPEAASARRRAAWMGRINALLGVALLLAAIRLARG